jgi:hypothetical protein
MKAFGRFLNVLLAVVLAYSLCGGNFTNRAYACSPSANFPLQNVLSQTPATCPCCATTPAACCPSEPVPTDSQPFDASASVSKRLTAKTLTLQPIRLLANVDVTSTAHFSPQASTYSTSKNYVSPLRLYLVFRALLI